MTRYGLHKFNAIGKKRIPRPAMPDNGYKGSVAVHMEAGTQVGLRYTAALLYIYKFADRNQNHNSNEPIYIPMDRTDLK